MPLILSGNVASATAGGYEVANSCRFQDSDSSEMSRAIASTGSNTTWTVSAWVKRVELGQSSPIFGTGDGGANNDARMVFFDAADAIECSYYNSGYTYEVTTNRLFRDLSSWYHICILFDTTESTAADRVKIYVNGVKETSFATSSYPSEDAAFNFGNTSYTHYVNDMGGRNIRGSHYIAELVYIDGTASAVTNFGEFDEDSPTIWKPKDVSGLSVGTNGVYLDFEDSANLGKAVDGGTDFTEASLDAQNQSSDSPTNNFATFNPLDVNAGTATTFAEGNLSIMHNNGENGAVTASRSTIAYSAGKWYWEVKCIAVGGDVRTGIISMSSSDYNTESNPYVLNECYNYKQNANKGNSGGDASYGNTYTADDIIGIAHDVGAGTLTFYKNGVSQGVAFTGLSTSITWGAFSSEYNQGKYEYNFGNPPYANSSDAADGNGYGAFEYAPPSNHLALCTKNLGSDGG